MKIILTVFLSLFAFTLLQAQDNKGPKIEFENEVHDFGAFDEGENLSHVFTFTNTGNTPLVITQVRPSCGCTTPEWSREPVMPGKTGSITATYNSQGRPGIFHKGITITTNEPENNQKVIYIRGDVKRRATTDF